MIVNRPIYMEALTPFIGQPLVKILSGIRRCGKSTIFEMLKEKLLDSGIKEANIICKRYTRNCRLGKSNKFFVRKRKCRYICNGFKFKINVE